ncbi:cyclase family protein [Pseudaminobacter sp. NGMCC 1.201702]|uniref:cyclase family protein n=1 Tax=Pseudaminobacter sp. NGMCC 1.201702 TaxID=3391825 RepID=UPI0039F10949
MATIIDLAVPIKDGDGRLQSKVEFSTPYTYDALNWQGSSVCMFCHHGTHVDAPNHFIKDGASIDEVPINSLIGPAAVIDLSDHADSCAIHGDTLEDRGRHTQRGDIAILRTDWSDKHWGTDRFWTSGPFLANSAAEWLVERGVKAIVYDFSEEFVVRKPGFRGEECEIHHKILGNDIYNIEYVRGLGKIAAPRTAIVAMPLKLVGLDGSPARVVALEGVDLPREFEVK